MLGCKTVSPPRLGRSQGLFDVAQSYLFIFFTHSTSLFVSLYSSHPQLLSELFMASAGMTMKLGFCKTSRDDNMEECSFSFRCGRFSDDEGFFVVAQLMIKIMSATKEKTIIQISTS